MALLSYEIGSRKLGEGIFSLLFQMGVWNLSVWVGEKSSENPLLSSA